MEADTSCEEQQSGHVSFLSRNKLNNLAVLFLLVQSILYIRLYLRLNIFLRCFTRKILKTAGISLNRKVKLTGSNCRLWKLHPCSTFEIVLSYPPLFPFQWSFFCWEMSYFVPFLLMRFPTLDPKTCRLCSLHRTEKYISFSVHLTHYPSHSYWGWMVAWNLPPDR